MSVSGVIKEVSHTAGYPTHLSDARTHLDELYPDIDVLLGHVDPSNDVRYQATRRGKRRRTLLEELEHWGREEKAASDELEKTSSTLPTLLDETQTRLQNLLSSAQKLALERHALADQSTGLSEGLAHVISDQFGDSKTQGKTLLQMMADVQDELGRLEAGLAWASVLEQVVELSEKALSPESHRPSPVAALPVYKALHERVEGFTNTLPQGMALCDVLMEVRDTTWKGLVDIMTSNLLKSCETIKWPTKLSYAALPAEHRRVFERSFQDLLIFQAEGDLLRDPAPRVDWTTGPRLSAVQALTQPIELRFKYHFQGGKTTNRLDKPEWAFANILDQIYEHTPFLSTTLTRLSDIGYRDIDIRSEFILSLLGVVLNLLRTRMPKLLDRPALLAHTIHQTIIFDEAIREGGFDDGRTLWGREAADAGEVSKWDGLTGVVLREEGWFERWLAGEKKFVDAQLHDIIASSDAWTITDEAIDDHEHVSDSGKPTVSARQVKALIEQVTDRYSPLPDLKHRLPFLQTIQLPSLQAYHTRISGSLDAFENLSSAFARAIPGALSGNTRGGLHFEQSKLTGGEAGLGRLIKADLSARWLLQALRTWADETFFIELGSDIRGDAAARWRADSDPNMPSDDATVFAVLIERFEHLCARAEDMMVRLVTVEVENNLKEHLKRRWDVAPGVTLEPSQHLLSALTTYTSLLRLLASELPPLPLARLYRRIASHIVNHITQRAVYSGWSKFTARGGKEFSAEVRDFVVASTDILGTISRPANIGVEIPWRPLIDAGRLLQLSDDGDESGVGARDIPTFKQAMAAGWADGPESLKLFLDRVSVRGMDRGQLQALLRRRVECWR